MNIRDIQQALLDIDMFLEDADIDERKKRKIHEFVDLLISHAITDEKVSVKVLGSRKIVAIPEGRLSYEKDVKDLRVQITQKIKEKML